MRVAAGRGRSRSTFQFVALLAIIVAAPLPLGANRPWALALLGLAIAALCVWHLLLPGLDLVEDRRRAAREARWACYALGGWLTLLALQLVPLPAGAVSALDFDTARRYAPSSDGCAALSLDPYSTRLYLLKAVILTAFFWLLLRLACTRRRLVGLAYAIVLSGFLQALIGIALFALDARYSIFFVKVHHSSATGTYVNPNHYAGYLVMALGVGIGLLISKLDDRRARGWRQWARDWLAVVMSDKARLRVMLLVMVIALISTRSRMGNAAFLAALLVAGGIALAFSRHSPRPVIVLLVSLVALDIVLIGSIIGVENLVRRIEQTRLLDVQWHDVPGEGKAQAPAASAAGDAGRQETLEQRTAAARAALPLAASFPLLGTGGGTFHLAFMPFRPPELRGYFDHVHNDFVEFAVETGLVGLALLAIVVVASLAHAVRILVVRRDPLARGMAFAALMGTAALLVHGTVDFNLQIPANALTFLTVLALPYLAGAKRRSKGQSAGLSRPKQITSPERLLNQNRNHGPDMSRKRVLQLAFPWLLLASAASAAEDPPDVPAPAAFDGPYPPTAVGVYRPPLQLEPTGVRLGPITLTPTLAMAAGHDDNVALRKTDKVSSSFYNVNPGLTGTARFGPHSYYARYLGNYGYYGSSSIDDYDDHGVSAGASSDWTIRARTQFRYDYFRGHDPRGSTAAAVARPDRWHTNLLAAMVGYGAPGAQGNIEADLALGNRRYDTNRAVNAARDYEHAEIGGAFYLRLRPAVYGFAQVRARRVDYDVNPTLDSTEMRYYGGMRWEATAKTLGAIKAGYMTKSFSDGSRPDASTYSYDASVTWSPLTYSVFTLNAVRTFSEQTSGGRYITTDNATLQWRHDWSSRVRSGLLYARGRDVHEGLGRTDIRQNLGLRASYGFRKNLRFGGEFRLEERSSNVATLDYTRRIALITLEGSL